MKEMARRELLSLFRLQSGLAASMTSLPLSCTGSAGHACQQHLPRSRGRRLPEFMINTITLTVN